MKYQKRSPLVAFWLNERYIPILHTRMSVAELWGSFTLACIPIVAWAVLLV